MSGVIFQCAACRSLTSASAVDVDGERAGLLCAVCGGVTVLPIKRTGAASGPRVVVDADGQSAGTAVVLPRALPPGSSHSSSPSSLPPAGAMVRAPASSSPMAGGGGGAMAGGFSDEVRARIVERLRKLPSGDDQHSLESMFENLLDKWSDGSEHKKLLKSASAGDQLAFVGQRYRAVLDEVPGDAAAKNAQNEIMTLAMAAMTARKDLGSVGGEKSSGKTAQIVVVAVLAVAVCVMMIWLLPRLLPGGPAGARIEDVDPGAR